MSFIKRLSIERRKSFPVNNCRDCFFFLFRVYFSATRSCLAIRNRTIQEKCHKSLRTDCVALAIISDVWRAPLRFAFDRRVPAQTTVNVSLGVSRARMFRPRIWWLPYTYRSICIARGAPRFEERVHAPTYEINRL